MLKREVLILMTDISCLDLNSGAKMPLLGLGVYKATGEHEVEDAIAAALDIGYRLFDTASAYKMKTVWAVRSKRLPSPGRNFCHHQNLE